MNKSVDQKKESSLNINSDFDFIFAKKWPSILRWILTIPMGILGMLLVHLAYGFIVSMLLKDLSAGSVVTMIVEAIFGFIKFYTFMIAMVAMAPVTKANKFKAGVGLSFVPFAIVIGFIFLATKYMETGLSTAGTIINIITVVLAVIVSLLSIRSEINKKEEPAGQQETPDIHQ